MSINHEACRTSEFTHTVSVDVDFGDSLRIGTNVVIHAISVSGKEVRLGIAAPREVSVYRKELLSRIKKEGHKKIP